MQVRRTITVIAKHRNRVIETIDLVAGQRLARGVVGSSEMRHDTVNTHVSKLTQRGDEFTQLIETNSEPAHARVDLYVNISHNAGVRRGLVQRFNHLEMIDDWC